VNIVALKRRKEINTLEEKHQRLKKISNKRKKIYNFETKICIEELISIHIQLKSQTLPNDKKFKTRFGFKEF